MPIVVLKSKLINVKPQRNRNVSTAVNPSLSTSILRGYITLENLETEFLSKQFGNDRPGYGSSGLPYIQTSIPPVPYLQNSKGPGFPIYDPATTGNLDYPIRGGNIDFQIGQQTFTLSSKIDSVRIKAFFSDPVRGPLFLQKQIGLQLTNPKIETGNTLFGLGQDFPLPGLLENTRVYNNGLNTLAQVGVSGTGAHAVRHGLVPFNPFQTNYYSIVNAQNINNNPVTNRLLNLNGLKMTSGVSPFVDPNNVFDLNTVNKLGISLNRNLLFQYLGGPGSSYGIGATTIKRTVDTTQLGVTFKKWASRTAMTYNQLKAQTINDTRIVDANNSDTDWRTAKTQILRSGLVFEAIENRKVDRRFYTQEEAAIGKSDKINQTNPFLFSVGQNGATTPWETPMSIVNGDDLIKFVFEAISNDDPTQATAIFFRALLTAGISDSNSATWNSFKYMGRGENFYTYQGFDRSVGFSFRVYAASESELIPIYSKLNTLVSQVYPDYQKDTNIMRSPLIRLTIGDYFYRMPGFLESVDLTVDNNYSWEITDGSQLPIIVNVAVKFKPIFYDLPRRAVAEVGAAMPKIITRGLGDPLRRGDSSPDTGTSKGNEVSIGNIEDQTNYIVGLIEANFDAYSSQIGITSAFTEYVRSNARRLAPYIAGQQDISNLNKQDRDAVISWNVFATDKGIDNKTLSTIVVSSVGGTNQFSNIG